MHIQESKSGRFFFALIRSSRWSRLSDFCFRLISICLCFEFVLYSGLFLPHVPQVHVVQDMPVIFKSLRMMEQSLPGPGALALLSLTA